MTTEEQKKTKRENGFYWVKYFDEWIVARWYNDGWHITFSSGKKVDSLFRKINETKLIPPVITYT